MNEKKLIEELYNFKTTQTDITHILRREISDNLSGDKYINELLQNADDKKSLSVEFILSGNILIYKHKGKHFDEKDVKGICHFGKGTKEADPDQIGNKGIGFKAVFSIAAAVTIISKNYCFRFEETYEAWKGEPNNYPWQLIPIWTEKETLPQVVKKHLDSESVHFILCLREELLEEVKDHLKKLSRETILFLNHIKSINCTFESDQEDKDSEKTEITLPVSEPSFQLESEKDDFSIHKIAIDENAAWYIYKRECEIPSKLKEHLKTTKEDIPSKYRTLDALPISIAVYSENGELIPVSNDDNVYCYLPTKIPIGIKFFVNAGFLLETSRMQLRDSHFANEWHAFIFERIFFEQVHFLNVLSLRLEMWRSIFDVLSIPEKVPVKFAKVCKKGFDEAIQAFHLVKSLADEGFRRVKPTIIDSFDFIAQFGSCAFRKNCAHPDISNNESHKNLLESLGANCIKNDQIIAEMKLPTFPEKIKIPKKNIAFMNFFEKLYKQTNTPQEREKLKNVFFDTSFVLTNRGNLKKPSEVKFHCETLEEITKKFDFIETVHNDLFHSPAKDWLISDVVKIASLKLEDVIAEANKFPDKLIEFTYHLENFIELNEDNLETLKKLKVKGSDGKIKNANDCYLRDALDPVDKIEILVGKDSPFLLHADYWKGSSSNEKHKNFLTAMGVHQGITIDTLKKVTIAVNHYKNAKQLIIFTQKIFTQYFLEEETQAKLISAIKWLNVVTQKNEVLPAKDAYLADSYNPEQPIEKIAKNLPCVSNGYVQNASQIQDWSNFFSQLGVKQKIEANPLDNRMRHFLIKEDKAALGYFQHLETASNGNLYLGGKKEEVDQHVLSSYVKIDFVENILATSLFWETLAKQWSKFSFLLYPNKVSYKYSSIRYYYGRSSPSQKTVQIGSNIHYLVDRAIKSKYGKNKKTEDYYGYAMREQLGNYAELLQIADVTQGFDEKQLQLLSFKVNLSFDDCQRLLMAIAKANQHEKDFSKIIFLYETLVEHINKNKSLQFDKNLLLLHQKESFSLATSLYYILDDHLPHAFNEHLIRKPEKISSYDFQKICSLAGVTLINFEDLKVVHENAVDSTLKARIQERLLYIICLGARKKDFTGNTLKTAGREMLSQVKAKLEMLQCYCYKDIQVSYKDIVREMVGVWIQEANTALYHDLLDELDSDDENKLYGFLYSYLEINFDLSDFLSMMTCSKEKLKRKYQDYVGDLEMKDFSEKTALQEIDDQENLGFSEKTSLSQAEFLNTPTLNPFLPVDDKGDSEIIIDDTEQQTVWLSQQKNQSGALTNFSSSTLSNSDAPFSSQLFPTSSLSSSTTSSTSNAQIKRPAGNNVSPPERQKRRKTDHSSSFFQPSSSQVPSSAVSQNSSFIHNPPRSAGKALPQPGNFVSVKKKQSPAPTQSEPADNKEIGDLGEKFVYETFKKMLIEQLHVEPIDTEEGVKFVVNSTKTIFLNWYNKNKKESEYEGPVDLTVSLNENVLYYIEVKSTPTALDKNKGFFLSPNEWKYMRTYQKKSILVRICEANLEPKPLIIKDPFGMIIKGWITLTDENRFCFDIPDDADVSSFILQENEEDKEIGCRIS